MSGDVTLRARAHTALAAAAAPDVRRALWLGTARVELAPPAALVRATQAPAAHDAASRDTASRETTERETTERDTARWPLAAAALAAVAARLRRPAVPAWRELAQAPRDPRPSLAGPARASLLRLVEAKGAAFEDELVLDAVAYALRAAGVALHPFDVPRLTRLVRSPRFTPGPTEAAWLAYVRPAAEAEVEGPPGPGDLADTSDWRSAPMQARVAHVRALRAEDPDAGCALVAATFATEPAAARAKLVAALEVGLSRADLPWLEPLRADRSQLVKDAVQGLLVRVRGTPEAAARVAEAVLCVTRSEPKGLVEKLLRRGPRFGLAVPEAARKRGSALLWALETFADVTLADLCAALGATPRELAAGAEDEGVLQTVLLAAALEGAERLQPGETAGPHDPAELATHLPDADWSALVQREAARATPFAAHASVIRCLGPRAWTELPGPGLLAAMHRASGGPLPPEVAEALVTSAALRGFSEVLQGRTSPGDERTLRAAESAAPATCVALAGLCGGPARPAFRAVLAEVPLAHRSRATLLSDVLEALERPGA